MDVFIKKENKRRPVLLINPPNELDASINNKSRVGVIYPPGGLLSLAACLEKERFPVKIMDLMADTRPIKSLIDEINSFRPFFIGITSTSPQIRGATSLARLIKEHFPEVLVGVGGPHPSAYYNHLRKIPYFDFIFVGEGEITFPKLLLELEKKIQGDKLYVNRKYVKRIYFGEEVRDLDSLPWMARHLLKDIYSLGTYKRFSTIHSGRGCPFRCVYCSSPIERRKSYRARSAENVINEIEHCVNDLKSEFILFTDDTFTTDRKRVISICNGIIKRRIKVKFCCETRVELVDEELLRVMKKAGLTEIQFGIESGSERIRKDIIHKNFSQEQLEKALFLCKKLRIYSIAFIMMGFPSETKEDLLATHKLCLKLPVNVIGIHFTVIMPGSELYGIAVKEKRITDDYWNRYALGESIDQPIYIPDGISKGFMEKLRILTYHKFYLNYRFIINRIIYDITDPRNILNDLRMAFKILKKGKTDRGRE